MASIALGNPQSRNMRVGLRVLVVDDDPLSLLIAERMLTTKHYNVTTATRGEEALAFLKNCNDGFDLVLSDLHMPGMDGFQLLAIVTALYDIPFLFMSSDHKLNVMERGLEAGARFFFTKPLTMNNYENMWQFVYTENIEYFEAMNIGGGGPPPPPPPSPPDRSGSLSISDDIPRNGRNSSSSSNTRNGKKRSQDNGPDNKKQKKHYKNHGEEDQDFGKKTAVVPLKKTRVVWTAQLHEKFLQAISKLSMARKRVVPRRIHALMKVRELNVSNIASHLQKYHMHLNNCKGTLESNYPRSRMRNHLPDETKYHSPSRDHSMRYNSSNYQNQPQSPLLADGQKLRNNFCSPNNINHMHSARLQYHFQEGSNDNSIAQDNYGNPIDVSNPVYLGRTWMSGAQTMNQSDVGVYWSLGGTSATLSGNDLNIGSTTNGTPIMAEQQATQGNVGFPSYEPIDPNIGNLSFESLQIPLTLVDIGNMGPFGALNGISTRTMGDEIPNNVNSTWISKMDEIQKGDRPVEEVDDIFSLSDDPVYLNGKNTDITSLDEPFVVNPNYDILGDTRALVNPNKLQLENEDNNNGWFNFVNDNIEELLLNQGYENANQEKRGGYVDLDFDPSGFLQDEDNIPGVI